MLFADDFVDPRDGITLVAGELIHSRRLHVLRK